MLSKMQKNVFALAVLATTSLPVMAAESVDIKVIGTISPVACSPSLSGGGVVDYGTIKTNTLSADSYTALEEKQIDFAITCDGPAKVAIKAINGRPGTLPTALTENAGIGNASPTGIMFFNAGSANLGIVGLGLDGGAAADKNRIGGYSTRIDPTTALVDGEAVDGISAQESTMAWGKASTGAMYNSTSQRVISWAEPGSLTPKAFTTMSAKLGVQAFINKTSELDLTHEITLDGLTTLELVYL
ncbi:DUF1120 domain-containing protein [Serratia sp. D1N4]